MAEYTGLWGWDVVPGARVAGGRCSCGDPVCASPGAHPLGPGTEIKAGATLDEVSAAWSRAPGAAVLLPAGRAFDVIDVAAPRRPPRTGTAGTDGAAARPGDGHAGRPRAVLRRAGRRRRTAGTALPDGLGRRRLWICTVWAPAPMSPPRPPAGAGGPVRWLRPPSLDTAAPAPGETAAGHPGVHLPPFSGSLTRGPTGRGRPNRFRTRSEAPPHPLRRPGRDRTREERRDHRTGPLGGRYPGHADGTPTLPQAQASPCRRASGAPYPAAPAPQARAARGTPPLSRRSARPRTPRARTAPGRPPPRRDPPASPARPVLAGPRSRCRPWPCRPAWSARCR